MIREDIVNIYSGNSFRQYSHKPGVWSTI